MINQKYLSVILTKIKDNQNVILNLCFGLLPYSSVLFCFVFSAGANTSVEKYLEVTEVWDESLLTPMLYYRINTINTNI